MKQKGILGIFIFLIGLMMCGGPMHVKAAEDNHWYTWKEKDGIVGWYLSDGDNDDTFIETMPEALGYYDDLSIETTLDDISRAYLAGLSGIVGRVNVYTDEVVTIGNAETDLEVMDIITTKGNTTIYGDVSWATCSGGNLTINGDVLDYGEMELSGWGAGGDIIVNGNVPRITWTRKTTENEEDYDYFAGNVTVTGTVAEGQIIEYLYDNTIEEYTYQQVATINFCEAGVFSILNGVLSDKVPVTKTEVNFGDYYYRYFCYKGYGEQNVWDMEAYNSETDVYAWSKDCEQSDVPENADVWIMDTATPVVFDFNLCSLFVDSGDVTVNGSIIEGGHFAGFITGTPSYKRSLNVMITGDVYSASVWWYSYNPNWNVTIGGKVKEGTYGQEGEMYSFTCENVKLVENGIWNPNVYLSMNTDNGDISYQVPDNKELLDILGNTDIGIGSEAVLDNGKEIVKTASVIIQSTASDVMENIVNTDDFKKILNNYTNAEPICALDINVNAYYVEKESGSVCTEAGYESKSITELPGEMTFVVKVPAQHYEEAASYQIVRNHVNADGSVSVEALETTQNGDRLTFKSNKFSTFVIVEVKAEEPTKPEEPTEPEEPAEPEEPVKPEEPTEPEKPEKPTEPEAPSHDDSDNSDTEETGLITYTIARGDTLSGIAKKYQITLREILALNPQIKNPNRIYPGQVLTLGRMQVASKGTEGEALKDAVYDTVQRGDSISDSNQESCFTSQSLPVKSQTGGTEIYFRGSEGKSQIVN